MFSNWFKRIKRIDTAKVLRHQKEIDTLQQKRHVIKSKIADLEKEKLKIKNDIRKLLEDQY